MRLIPWTPSLLLCITHILEMAPALSVRALLLKPRAFMQIVRCFFASVRLSGRYLVLGLLLSTYVPAAMKRRDRGTKNILRRYEVYKELGEDVYIFHDA
jgi:hypothetical protein